MVHRLRVANLDADDLSRNPRVSQEDGSGARWHGEIDEEMVYSWHASNFLCLLRGDSSIEYHLTSYSNQRVDGESLDLELEDGVMNQRDIHNDALVLKFLRTSMVVGIMSAKEQDHVLQHAKKYQLKVTYVLQV